MKIAVVLQSRRFFKYYYESGCFNELEKEHDVTYAILKSDVESIKKLEEQKKKTSLIQYVPNSKTYRYFEIYSYLSLKRHSSRSRSFSLKFGNFYKAWSRKGKLFHLVLSLPILFEAFAFIFKAVLSGNPLSHESFMKDKPDYIIVPSGGTMDVYSMLSFKAARSLNIGSILLMFNWDNITCKGVYPFQPSYALLWGEQSKRHYLKINRVKEKKALVIGSAQFGTYEEDKPSSVKKINLRKQFGISEDIVLGSYLGGARYRSDVELLKKLDPILSEYNLALVYRPHPWQDNDMLEEDFYNETFESIYMDPSMEFHYKNSRKNPEYNMKSFIPELDYFPAFLSEIDFSISSYSTMSLESIKMGKPVVLAGYKDKKFPYSFDKLRTYEHHDEWKNIEYVFECLSESELKQSIEKIKEWTRNSEVSHKLVESSKIISYFDERTYSRRLADITQQVIAVKEI